MGLAIGGIAGFLGGRASRDLPESAINVKIASELAPEGEGESRSAPSILEMPAGAEELVLVLRLPAQKDFPGYEAVISNAGAIESGRGRVCGRRR